MLLPLPLLVLLPIIFGLADYVTGRDFIEKLGLRGRSIWYVAPLLIWVFTALGHPATPLPEPAAAHIRDVGAWAWFSGRDWWVWFFHSGGSIPLTWAMWRSVLGWSSMGGRLDPQTPDDTISLEGRNLLSAIPFYLAMTLGLGMNSLLAFGGTCVFCTGAMATNVWYSYEARKGRDVDPEVDAIHGAMFGLLVFFLLMLQAFARPAQ